MHQQWKKHSGFSEHNYAEHSSRRFCLSEFSTVVIQTGLPSQFLAGVLELTKKELGRAVLPASPGLHLLPRMSENEAGGRGQTRKRRKEGSERAKSQHCDPLEGTLVLACPHFCQMNANGGKTHQSNKIL